LSNERSSKFWPNKGREKIKVYIREAYYDYQLWGAKRKVEIWREYPQFLSEVTQTKGASDYVSTNLQPVAHTVFLDLMTVVKASQTCW